MSQLRSQMEDGVFQAHGPALYAAESGGDRHRSHTDDTPELDRAQEELEQLRERQRQIMELIGCANPERMVHDLRNLLNEMQLLRMLTDLDRQQ